MKFDSLDGILPKIGVSARMTERYRVQQVYVIKEVNVILGMKGG